MSQVYHSLRFIFTGSCLAVVIGVCLLFVLCNHILSWERVFKVSTGSKSPGYSRTRGPFPGGACIRML